MKEYFYIALKVLLLALALMLVLQFAKENFPHYEYQEEPQELPVIGDLPGLDSNLKACSNNKHNIKFLCDFRWKQSETETGLIYRVDEKPDVTFKFSKVDLGIMFVSQLNRDKLNSLGFYKEGFATEDLTIAGQKAIMVKAFAKRDENMRLTDYYFVRDKILFMLMFSVKPKEQWNDYKFIFQNVVSNFEFIN